MSTSTQSTAAAGRRLELPVSTRKLETHWAAHAPNRGITVFAATEPAARQRMNAARRFRTETAVGPGSAARQEFKEYPKPTASSFPIKPSQMLKALDFCCGAGGLTRGLLDAGIAVADGIDNAPPPPPGGRKPMKPTTPPAVS